MTQDSSEDEAPAGSSSDRRDRLERMRQKLRRSLAHLTDAELVDALRRRERGVMDAFVHRFHAIILNYARRAGFAEEECDQIVQEVLHDVALDLVVNGRPVPHNVRRYMIGAFRHRYFKYLRDSERQERRVREAGVELAHEHDDEGRRAVAAGCSEYALREADGRHHEEAPLSPVLRRLSSMLVEGLTPDESAMLHWLSEGLPSARSPNGSVSITR